MKKGYIRISKQLYENEYHLVLLIFQKFRPIKIDYEYWVDTYVIYGVSDEFDELKEGRVPPQYYAEFTRHEDKSITMEFKKE